MKKPNTEHKFPFVITVYFVFFVCVCQNNKPRTKTNKYEEKIIIILVVNAAWKLFESGTESTQLLNEFNSLAPTHFVQCTL